MIKTYNFFALEIVVFVCCFFFCASCNKRQIIFLFLLNYVIIHIGNTNEKISPHHTFYKLISLSIEWNTQYSYLHTHTHIYHILSSLLKEKFFSLSFFFCFLFFFSNLASCCCNFCPTIIIHIKKPLLLNLATIIIKEKSLGRYSIQFDSIPVLFLLFNRKHHHNEDHHITFPLSFFPICVCLRPQNRQQQHLKITTINSDLNFQVTG